jgi:hypothetical protein
MPGGYEGRLLAVAVSGDGLRVAAAGEAVLSDRLRPLAPPRASGLGAAAPVGATDADGGALEGAVAAAAAARAVGRRRRGQKGGAIALDALDALGAEGEALGQLSLDETKQQQADAGHQHGGLQQQELTRAPLYVFERVL